MTAIPGTIILLVRCPMDYGTGGLRVSAVTSETEIIVASRLESL